MSDALTAFSQRLIEAVRARAGCVVALPGRRSPASGVVWRPGMIVAAEHTIGAEDEITVTGDRGKTVTARLAGRDPGTDLALLRIDEEALPAMERTSASYEPGSLILAVGRSANAGPVASMGIVSAKAPSFRTWRGGRLDEYIRLDIGMYTGTSGSLVLAVEGGVIGVATSALSRVAGLAIPASTVDRVVDQLLTRGQTSRGYLGLGLQPVELPRHQIEQVDVRGLMVVMVEPGGPAAQAEILLGDILLDLSGTKTHDTDDVQNVLEEYPPGSRVHAAVLRGGQKKMVEIVVGERGDAR